MELTIATLVKLALSGVFAFKGGVLVLLPRVKRARAEAWGLLAILLLPVIYLVAATP